MIRSIKFRFLLSRFAARFGDRVRGEFRTFHWPARSGISRKIAENNLIESIEVTQHRFDLSRHRFAPPAIGVAARLAPSHLLFSPLQLAQIIALCTVTCSGKAEKEQHNKRSRFSRRRRLCCCWRKEEKKRRGEAERSEEGKERKPKSEQFNCVLVPKELRCAEEPRCLRREKNYIFSVNSHWWRR